MGGRSRVVAEALHLGVVGDSREGHSGGGREDDGIQLSVAHPREPRVDVAADVADVDPRVVPQGLRDTGTDTKKFRELVRELTWLLGYEAMADLATRARRVQTPLEGSDPDWSPLLP